VIVLVASNMAKEWWVHRRRQRSRCDSKANDLKLHHISPSAADLGDHVKP
jgi:hypothetical protein